ncbi:MAG: hypothetical protein PVH05_03675 [Burkholderiales bacterium]
MQTRKIIAASLLILLPSIAAAADKAFTVYGGYRDGGQFTDADTDQSLDLEGSGAISLALDFAKDAARAYQVFLSYQSTDLSFENSSSGSSDSVGMDVTYLHVGGTNFWEGTLGKGPYVVGGLGVTFYDPGAGYDSELRPSLNLGIGYEQPLSKRFSLRFEARGYATFVNSSGGFFCSGGCVVSISADVIGQGEVMMGLSARF